MMRRHKNGGRCPVCQYGTLRQHGLAQVCDRCDAITMEANNATIFAALREGEEFVFEYDPFVVFVKGKPESAPESLDISSVPDFLQEAAMRHNRVVMHVKNEPTRYGFCSPNTRVVRADQRRVYGYFSWN